MKPLFIFIFLICLSLKGQQIVVNDMYSGPCIKLVAQPSDTTAENIITLDFQIEDPKYKVTRLHLFCDGIPMYGGQGKDISHIKQKRKTPFSVPVEIELIGGKNLISLVVENEKGVKSDFFEFEIECTKPFKKPTVYIVSIGTSSFYNPEYNLTYAARDAELFANTFLNEFYKNNNEGITSIFEKVKFLVLKNNQVYRSNIANARLFLSNATPNDIVIMFVASHGLLDENKNYFLATYDMDFKNPALKGLPYSDLEEVFDITSARKKIFLIDACYSGEADNAEGNAVQSSSVENGTVKSRGFKPVSLNGGPSQKGALDVMKKTLTDMSKNKGVFIISSAGGNEFAFESKDWKNGVFTYSLINGLISRKADLNNDNVIRIKELSDYVSEQVKNITNGRQNPTTRNENLKNDFIIWK